MRSSHVLLSKSFSGSPLQTVVWLWYCRLRPRTIYIGNNKVWCSSSVQVADSSLVSHSPLPTFRQWMNDSKCISWCSVHLDYQRMTNWGFKIDKTWCNPHIKKNFKNIFPCCQFSLNHWPFSFKIRYNNFRIFVKNFQNLYDFPHFLNLNLKFRLS